MLGRRAPVVVVVVLLLLLIMMMMMIIIIKQVAAVTCRGPQPGLSGREDVARGSQQGIIGCYAITI